MDSLNKNTRPTGYEKYALRKEKARGRVKKTKDLGLWISECDERLSQELDRIAEEISAEGEIKLIRLIGPTCSGKTTAARMLKKRFSDLGKRLHVISLDDFYFDTDILRQMSLQNGNEKIDYDSPCTIDTAELARFVREIFTNDRSHCPIFDFSIGKRNGYREYLCEDRDIFLFEGIQALYPSVSGIFAELGHLSAEIYIAPQSSVKIGGSVFLPNEIRLLRRIVRDRNFRNTEAEFTFDLWQGVRENEEKNIFPYVGGCKYSIDSTMPYEIGVLKPYLVSALSAMPQGSIHKEAADGILKKIENIVPVSDKLISSESIYKEFV